MQVSASYLLVSIDKYGWSGVFCQQPGPVLPADTIADLCVLGQIPWEESAGFHPEKPGTLRACPNRLVRTLVFLRGSGLPHLGYQWNGPKKFCPVALYVFFHKWDEPRGIAHARTKTPQLPVQSSSMSYPPLIGAAPYSDNNIVGGHPGGFSITKYHAFFDQRPCILAHLYVPVLIDGFNSG